MSNKPIFTSKDGLIEIAVWEKQTKDDGTMFSYELVRNYKDDSGEWKKSHSLSGTEPLVAAALYQRAYAQVAKIREQRRSAQSENKEAA